MRINILRINRLSGTKNGRDWKIAEAKCIFQAPNRETGEMEPDTGGMLLPTELHDIQPGEYDAQVAPFCNREGRIEIRITKLSPVVAGKSAISKDAALS